MRIELIECESCGIVTERTDLCWKHKGSWFCERCADEICEELEKRDWDR